MDIRMSHYGTDILHHSRFTAYRLPHGAVPMGEKVRLRLSVSETLPEVACLLVYWINDEEDIKEMARVEVPGSQYRRWFETVLEMPEQTCVVWYAFILNDGARLMYYGSKLGGGRGEVYDSPPPPFQITVYDESFMTPPWFQYATMYQIFVDRFHKGAGNNAFLRAKEHEKLGRRIIKHTSWDEQPDYAAEPGEEHYTPDDFFGGDLEGIIEKLPYIKSLGADVIYLNPIFESPSNHKYDTGDYKRVDPMFGTENELRALCQKAGELGISVMLDGVFSHTGADSRYFNRDGKYDETGAFQSDQSRYFNWYTFFEHPHKYASWWGFQSLPEVRETEKGYMDFIMREPGNVIEHWAKAGIRGWRLDVADELPDEFIREFRTRLKANDPDSVLLGEVWEDASTKVSGGVKRQYVMGHELDSVMNYPFRTAVLDYFLGRADAHGLNNALSRLRENFPEPFYLCAMNLLSSHDVPRSLSLLSGAPDKDVGLSREEQAVYRLMPEQLELGVRRMKLAALLQFSLPGVASIYYGEEAGCVGLMDPFNRGTYPWGKENTELLEHYKLLAELRKKYFGRCHDGMVMGAPDNYVIAIVRFSDADSQCTDACPGSICVTLINRALLKANVTLRFQMLMEGPDALRLTFMDVNGLYRDELTGKEYTCVDSQIDIEMDDLSAAVLVKV